MKAWGWSAFITLAFAIGSLVLFIALQWYVRSQDFKLMLFDGATYRPAFDSPMLGRLLLTLGCAATYGLFVSLAMIVRFKRLDLALANLAEREGT